ncbi:MAG TPA: toprim domain-containing protein [Armatimonadota bacterium]|nr:toprim domain-containing protein [Armatimonadota bacterium]
MNTGSGLWKCHRCGASGILEEYRSQDYSRVNPQYTTTYRQRLFQDDARQQQSNDSKWRKWLTGLQPLHDTSGAEYLQSRGLSIELAMKAEVKYHPAWFGCKPAVVFPIRDQNRILVAAHGRYISDTPSSPRMRSAGSIKQGVFQTTNAFTGQILCVTEAPIDALTLMASGLPAVATCGAKNFPSWFPVACKNKRILIAYDPDQAGEDGAQMLYHALRDQHISPERFTPNQGDWNDNLQKYGLNALKQAIDAAIISTPKNIGEYSGIH